MKNLFQRLSEENKQKLIDNGKEYPTTTSILFGILTEKTSWSSLTLADAMSLWFVFETSKPFNLEKFTNLFEK